MTSDEYRAKLRDPLWQGEKDENGVDLSLIRFLLSLTPTERVRLMDGRRKALLQQQKRAHNERPRA